MKYLHQIAPGIFWLDHRLTPEVRGMLAAMSSRAPVGGVKARYEQIIQAVVEAELYYQEWPTLTECRELPEGCLERESLPAMFEEAEERLCSYPLHPKVQSFFDDFVGKYGHCYDGKTEVLARIDGRTAWYLWPDFCRYHESGVSVEVAAFDPSLDGVRFEKPLAVIRKSHKGRMYRVTKQRGNIDLLVTPEHTMLVRKRMYVGSEREAAGYEWSDWRGVRAEEVAGKTTYRYKRGASRHLSVVQELPAEADPWGFSRDMLTFGRLCGFFVGDGHVNKRQSSYLSFNLRKQRELDYLADIVRTLDLDVIDGGNGCQHISLTGAREWALAHFYAPEPERTHKKGWDTRVPEWVLHAPEPFVLGFLDGLRNSDGSNVTEESWHCPSVSQSVLEAIQILGTMWGCPVSIRRTSPEDVGQAFVSGSKCMEPVINRNTIEDGWEDYDGEVYCATTSTGFLVVRRNFATVVSGNSSIMELVGGQAVFAEGISWLTAWLLFDSPLCTGQEFSTRAVQHADWPMARECFDRHEEPEYVHEGESVHYEDGGIAIHAEPGDVGLEVLTGRLDLTALHRDWFEVFEAEVAWWKEHLTDEANRKALGIGDKEPFRPALDRARWALPGTIATGCGHTSHLRDRARVLRDGSLLAQSSKAPAAEAVWNDLAKAYKEALPGLSGMGLREAVYGAESQIPGHLATMFSSAPDGPDAEIDCAFTEGLSDVRPFKRTKEKSYSDPLANSVYRVNVTFRCSLAVARDWHRQRTAYPWHLQVVRAQHLTAEPGPIQIDSHYAPMSDIGKAKVPDLLRRSTEVFDRFMADRNLMQAGLALPLGTRVRLRGQAGLRDAIYLLELRKYAHGANFEYQDQATKALDQLREAMKDASLPDGDENASIADTFGLVP